MLNLTKDEKTVLIFIAACFIAGSGLSFLKKSSFVPQKAAYSEAASQDASMKNHPSANGAGLICDDEIIDKVNINKAGLDELMRLKGIGETIADRIIGYRERYGPFFTKEDIMKVKGIGKAKFGAVKDGITVE